MSASTLARHETGDTRRDTALKPDHKPTRICRRPVPSFRPDGTLADLAAPRPELIDFAEIASRLARLARFTGAASSGGQGMSISVAQHSVMGAQALMAEGESRLTGALFLLHDAHEYAIGDEASPVTTLLAATMEELSAGARLIYEAARARIKYRWDEAIYGAANLPPPPDWNRRTQGVIKSMDMRMMAAEAEALFGPAARHRLPLSSFPTPRIRGVIEPWGAMKAEAEFLELFHRLAPPQRWRGMAIRPVA